MPIVRMPDGALVRFPDDMPQDEIGGQIQKWYPDAFADSAPPQAATPAPKAPQVGASSFSGSTNSNFDEGLFADPFSISSPTPDPAPKTASQVDPTLKGSVFADTPATKQTSPMRPEFRAKVQKEFDAATPEQRTQMLDSETAAGRVAIQRKGAYDAVQAAIEENNANSPLSRIISEPARPELASFAAPVDREKLSLEQQNKLFNDETTFTERFLNNLNASLITGKQATSGNAILGLTERAQAAELGSMTIPSGTAGLFGGESFAFSEEQGKAIAADSRKAIQANAKTLVQLAKERQSIPGRPATKALSEAQTLDQVLAAVSTDPLGVIGDLGVQSAPLIAPSLVAAMANPVLGVGATFANSMALEKGLAVPDVLQDKLGANFNEQTAAKAALDPELIQEAETRGLIRGGLIGSLDAASMGLAGKSLAPFIKNAATREAVNGLIAQPLAQMTLGAGGEALAQLATDGEIKLGEVVAEALGEAFTAPLDVASMSKDRIASAITPDSVKLARAIKGDVDSSQFARSADEAAVESLRNTNARDQNFGLIESQLQNASNAATGAAANPEEDKTTPAASVSTQAPEMPAVEQSAPVQQLPEVTAPQAQSQDNLIRASETRTFASEREAMVAARASGVENPTIVAEQAGRFSWKAPETPRLIESVLNENPELYGAAPATPATTVQPTASVSTGATQTASTLPTQNTSIVLDSSPVAMSLRKVVNEFGKQVGLEPDVARPEDVAFRRPDAGLEALGRALGVEVVVFDSIDDNGNVTDQKYLFNGAYKDGRVYIRGSGAENPALSIFGHEWYHSLEKRAPALAKRFSDQWQAYRSTPEWGQYKEALLGRGYSERQLESESAADMFGLLVSDPSFLQTLAKNEPSLFKSIVDSLKRLIDQVLNFGPAQQEELVPMIREYQKLFDTAVGIAQEYGIAVQQGTTDQFAQGNASQTQSSPNLPNQAQGQQAVEQGVPFSVPRSTRDIIRNPSDFKKKYGLTDGKNTTRKIGEALNQLTLDTVGQIPDNETSQEAGKEIAIAMADEVAHQLGKPRSSGIGWYSKNYPKALKELGRIYPELSTSKGARSTFTAILAVTSNGEKVARNVTMARQVYEVYRMGGDITQNIPGTKRPDVLAANLQAIKEGVAKLGELGFAKAMLNETTVAEMNKILRAKGEQTNSDYPADMVMPLAATAFGPKLGAFYANLMGSSGYLTMDLWWSRTFNRMRGTLIPQPTQGSLDYMRNAFGEPEAEIERLVELAEPFQKSYADRGFKNGTELEKRANTFMKSAVQELNEAPFRGSDRRFMFQTAQQAQAILKERGYDLTIADIQAALWYYEKRLYGALGSRVVGDIGYLEALNDAANNGDRSERPATRSDGTGNGQGAGNRQEPMAGSGRDVPQANQGQAAGSARNRRRVGDQPKANNKAADDAAFSIPSRKQTQTSEFKRWFGDSKVVDADGKPMVVYHGTNQRITAFDPARIGARDAGFFGAGFYLTPDENTALDYAETAVEDTGEGEATAIPLYVSLQNPFVWDMSDEGAGATRADLASLGIRREIVRGNSAALSNTKEREVFNRAVREQGYDGVVVRDEDGIQEIVAFSPTQIKSAIGNNGLFDPENPDIRFSAPQRKIGPNGMYSKLLDVVQNVPAKLREQPAPQWKAWLMSNAGKLGVKKDEIEWSGVMDYLDLAGKEKVTSEGIAQYLEENGVQVVETNLRETEDIKSLTASVAQRYGFEVENYGEEFWFQDQNGDIVEDEDLPEAMMAELESIQDSEIARYSSYKTPGGKNYREVLLRLPTSSAKIEDLPRMRKRLETMNELAQDFRAEEDFERAVQFEEKAKVLSAQVEELEGLPPAQKIRSYKSSHWDQRNVVAHVRLQDFTDSTGSRVLFVDEVQSDWGQEGKKKGFMAKDTTGWKVRGTDPEDPSEVEVLDTTGRSVWQGEARGTDRQIIEIAANTGLPVAPFVTDTKGWLALALKRIMTLAVQGGYDKVAFVNGQQSADRYDLSKQVDSISWAETDTGLFNIGAFKNGALATGQDGLTIDEVADMLGKDIADKIKRDSETNVAGELSGVDLKVGGKGMIAFYDQIVPQEVRSLLKKFGGGQMEMVDLVNGDSDPSSNMISALASEFGGNRISRGAGLSQPGFTVTPELRQIVEDEGLPLFSVPQSKSQRNRLVMKDQNAADRGIFNNYSDKFLRLEQVEAFVTKKVGPIKVNGRELSPYKKQERYPGVRAELRNDFIADEVQPMLLALKKSATSADRLMTYRYALHAEERNQSIARRNKLMPDGGSGMLTQTSKDLLNGVDSEWEVEGVGKVKVKGFAPQERAKLDALMPELDKLINGTRDLLVNAGLESQDTIDAIRGVYKHWIPLAGKEDSADDGMMRGVGSGFSVFGSTLRVALGRQTAATDILGQVVQMREQAIDRFQKNEALKEVMQYFYELQSQGVDLVGSDNTLLVQINPKDTVRYFRKGTVEDFRADAAQALGKANQAVTPAEIEQYVNDRMFGGKASQQRVQAFIQFQAGTVNTRDFPAKMAENVSAMRVNGKDVLIRFNDPILAKAFRNMDAQQLGFVMTNILRPATGYFRNIYTAYNPFFWATNLMRDIGATTFGSIQDGYTMPARVLANMPAAFGHAAKGLYGQGSQVWDDFRLSGSRTGFVTSYRNARDRQVELLAEFGPSNPLKQGAALGKKLLNYFLTINSVFEDGVRLALFMSERQIGKSVDEAADAVRRISVNFNRKGFDSDRASSMYVFFNAAAQGSRTMKRALQSKEGMVGAAALVSLSTAMNMVTALALGEDDDGEPLWNSETVRNDRQNNILIPTFDPERPYILIPLQYGLNAIWNMGAVVPSLYMAAESDKNQQAVKEAIQVAKGFADGFLPPPIGGLFKQGPGAVVPTIAQPIAQPLLNTNGFGRPIVPGTDDQPRNERMFKSTRDSVYDNFVSTVNERLGGTPNDPVFEVSPEDVKNFMSVMFGSFNSTVLQMTAENKRGRETDALDNPFLRKFVANPDRLEQDDIGKFYERQRELDAAAKDVKVFRERGELDKAQEIAKQPEMQLRKKAGKIRERLGKLRDRRIELMRNKTMADEDRQAQLRELDLIEQQLVDGFNRQYNTVTGLIEGE